MLLMKDQEVMWHYVVELGWGRKLFAKFGVSPSLSLSGYRLYMPRPFMQLGRLIDTPERGVGAFGTKGHFHCGAA